MTQTGDQERADRRLARATEAVRGDVPDPADVDAAGRAVWERIAAGRPLRTCRDFAALAPDYVAGRLTEARLRLLEDHVVRCASCRRAVASARADVAASGAGIEGDAALGNAGEADRAPIGRQRGPGRVLRLPRRARPVAYAVAAAAALAVGLSVASVLGWLPFGPSSALAHVASVEGALYRVAGGSVEPLALGAQVGRGDTVRSAAGGRAVLVLADGSRIEMDDRSGLRLGRRPGGTTIDLERGRLIVRAAEQGAGRLTVHTQDCVATVKGTLFAVSHGAAGSRVSVLAGEVEVSERDGASTLGPGDQLVTGAGLPAVSLREEVAWSGDAESYRALAAELAVLQEEVVSALLPGGRTESRLLGLVPEDADLYVAMPNLGRALTESGRALDRRLAESEALRTWWEEAVAPSGAADDVREAIARLGPFGEALGDEIVVAGRVPAEGDDPAVVLLAEVADGDLLDRLLDDETGPLAPDADADEQAPWRRVDDPTAAIDAGSAPADELLVWRGARVLVAATDPALLRSAAGAASGEATGFQGSPLGARVAAAYERGVDWLFAVDLADGLQAAVAGDPRGPGIGSDEATASLAAAGILDARFLVVSQTGTEAGARTEAALAFEGARSGMAAWLAEPGPLGALRFVSADAVAAAAFVLRDPAQMLADLRGLASASGAPLDRDAYGEDEAAAMAAVETMAAALGGDMALAIDGPILPVPSWILAIEVYDPAGLRAAVEEAVDLRNRAARAEGGAPWRLEVAADDRSERWVLSMGAPEATVHASIADGYLVVARSRALVERAIRTMRSGTSLATADVVRDAIRREGYLDVSALFYQDVAGSLDDLAGGLVDGVVGGAAARSGSQPGPEAPAAAELAKALRGSGPTVLTIVAGTDEIRIQGDGPLGMLALPLVGEPGGHGWLAPHAGPAVP